MRRKISITLLFLLSFCLSYCLLFTKSVDAGIFQVNYGENEKQSGKRLDNEKWYFSEKIGNASKAYDYVLFDGSCDETDKLINREKVQNLKEFGFTDLLTFDTQINLFTPKEIPNKKAERKSGARFGVSFHLGYAADDLGAYESFYVYFEYQNDNNYKIKFSKFLDKEIVLFESEVFSFITADNINIHVASNTNGDTNIVIKKNFDEIVNENLNVDTLLDGFFGFLESEMFGAKVFYVNMKSKGYVSAENININEHFDNNCYNIKSMYSASFLSYVKGNTLKVIDDKLVFKNAGDAFISTKFEYSNFEFVFDLVDMKRESSEENGLFIPENASFGISFGADNYRDYLYTAPLKIIFSHENDNCFITLFLNDNQTVKREVQDKYNLWKDDKIYKIRLLYSDGTIVLGMNVDGDVGFKTLLSYTFMDDELVNAPFGYIRLFTEGRATYSKKYSTLANMTLDNFRITNFDDNGIVDTIDHISNVWLNEDFEYIDTWSDLDLAG